MRFMSGSRVSELVSLFLACNSFRPNSCGERNCGEVVCVLVIQSYINLCLPKFSLVSLFIKTGCLDLLEFVPPKVDG